MKECISNLMKKGDKFKKEILDSKFEEFHNIRWYGFDEYYDESDCESSESDLM